MYNICSRNIRNDLRRLIYMLLFDIASQNDRTCGSVFFFMFLPESTAGECIADMDRLAKKPRRGRTLPPEVWMLVDHMRGGRDFWLRQHRASVLPSMPRAAYRFSFVGVFRAGGAVLIHRGGHPAHPRGEAECVVRPGRRCASHCGFVPGHCQPVPVHARSLRRPAVGVGPDHSTKKNKTTISASCLKLVV